MTALHYNDPDENKVVDGTVTWPTKWLSALKVLSLPYFKGATVEKWLPADPVDTRPCGIPLIADNAPFINGAVMKDLLRILKQTEQSHKSTYYAATLLSEYSKKEVKITDTTIEAVNFIADSFSSLYSTNENDIPSQTKKEILKILISFDFKIVFPTCFDFMMEYVDTTTPFYRDNKNSLLKMLFVIFYLYSTNHSADEVAQIALAATGFSAENGLKVNCDSGLDIYTPEIYENLLNRRAVKGVLQPPK